MKLTLIKSLPILVLITACDSRTKQDFSGWTLAKTTQTREGDVLFSSFGSVSYQVYLNPVLAENIKNRSAIPVTSKAAIVVYANDQEPSKTPMLTGYLEKVQNSDGQGVWKAAAVDGEGKSFTDEQLANSCLPCHSLQSDGVLLGKYVQ